MPGKGLCGRHWHAVLPGCHPAAQGHEGVAPRWGRGGAAGRAVGRGGSGERRRRDELLHRVGVSAFGPLGRGFRRRCGPGRAGPARPPGGGRHEFEAAVLRFLIGFGYIFFVAIVLIPFYVMVMTSLKNAVGADCQPARFLDRPEPGLGAVPQLRGAVPRLQFRQLHVDLVLRVGADGADHAVVLHPRGLRGGAAAVPGAGVLSRSILLIYMVPMIVLALPIYIAFSMTGLRNSILGIVLIYPVTTIPVALYMLQGYFRGLPAEIEEAG
jgi:hypothetical protein